MILFDDHNRTYNAPALHNEDQFHFYNRSARPAAANIRKVLDNWYIKYPEEYKAELKSRFQSEFDSSFYELFLYNLLLSIGCKVNVHPLASPYSKTRPDFITTFPDHTQVFIEAVLSTGESNKHRSERALLNTLYDEINKIKSTDFFLSVVSVTNPKKTQPSGRNIRSFLKERLKGLNLDEILEVIKKGRMNAIPIWIYSEGDFEIQVSPIPKSPELRVKTGHSFIGIESGEAHWGGSSAALQNSVALKAKQHSQLNKPYIIAVNSISVWGTDNEDIFKAFYGNQGVFNKYTRISAILVTQVYPSNIPSATICLYHNPRAAKPCINLSWRINQAIFYETKWKLTEGKGVGELFGLPMTWPGKLF